MPSYSVDGCNCYLSGAITGQTTAELYKTFGKAEYWLSRCGAKNIFNPSSQVLFGKTHEQAMRYCIGELIMTDWDKSPDSPFYDYLVQVDGWENSRGAEVEKIVAEACGITVVSIHETE